MSEPPTSTRVPFLDLAAEIEAVGTEIAAAFERVLRSTRFILGPEVQAFEREAADYLGVRHAVGLNSGTDALVIGLRALGVRPGDEVITTAFTFFATAESISQLGAQPVFCDIEPESFNLDPARVAERITPRTRAIVPVHLFGHAADMDGICALAQEHGLALLEDLAQAFGARSGGRRLGARGDATACSFYPTKNLGAVGDAGLLATSSDAIAEQARLLRNHGQLPEYRYETLGYNSRLDELQAAALRVKLRHLDAWNEGRRKVASAYAARLADVPGLLLPTTRGAVEHSFHQFTVRVIDGRRDALRSHLAQAGIDTKVFYPVPLHTLPLYAERATPLPETERAAAQVLSLPIWPGLDAATLDRVCASIAGFMRG